MKNYIFATDFSKNALNALEFVVPFVKKLKGKIVVFHAYDSINAMVGVPIFITENLNKEKEIAVREELLIWKKLVRKMDATIPAKFMAKKRPFLSSLLAYAEEIEAAGIFMGTKGASGVKRILMGSNTASVLGKALCPVYAIPESCAFKGIRSIVYATDYREKDESILDQIQEIASANQAEVEILYIVKENTQLDLTIYDWYQETVKEKLSSLKVSFKAVHDANVQNGISTYVKAKQPDLVVMAMHRKNWIEKLTQDSQTRKQVFHTQKPLLILQSEKNLNEKKKLHHAHSN